MPKESKQKKQKENKAEKTKHTSLVTKLAAIIKGKRVVVFVDGSNLYYTLQSINKKFDYGRFEQWLKKHSTLKGIHYYAAFDPEDQKQIDFLTELNNLGYTTHQKPIKWVIDHYKGNMDVELAVDAMYYMNIYDVMILISGDGDFSYLCQTLDKVNRTTVILSMGGYTAQELHDSATNYFFLERIKTVWEYRPGRGGGGTVRKNKVQKDDVDQVEPIVHLDNSTETAPLTSAAENKAKISNNSRNPRNSRNNSGQKRNKNGTIDTNSISSEEAPIIHVD